MGYDSCPWDLNVFDKCTVTVPLVMDVVHISLWPNGKSTGRYSGIDFQYACRLRDFEIRRDEGIVGE